MERRRPREGHSRAGDGRGRHLSGHGKSATGEREALTSWRRQREELVGTWKGNLARGTHFLETERGWTHQDTERKQPSEKYSLPGDDRERNLSKHGKLATERGGTHELQTAEGGTCQDMERWQLREGHPLPGDGRGRDLSGHGKNATERGALTNWRR